MQSRRFFVACFFKLICRLFWVIGTDESGDLLKKSPNPDAVRFGTVARRLGILLKDVVSLATAFIGK